MIASGYKTIIHADILKQLSELDILYYYLGIDKVPIVINSPLRVDNSPSFGLILTETNHILYRDFATGDSGGLFKLLSLLWKCTYNQVFIKIDSDIEKILTGAPVQKNYIHYKKSVNHSPLDNFNVTLRPYRDYDYAFWAKFGINADWLNFGKVYPISHILLNSGDREYIIPAEKYAYVYVEFKDNNPSIKIYQPYSTHFKWRSLHNSSVWDLWSQLPPTGDKLIITSSRKDALSLWANVGIPATGLQAESCIPKPQVINELKARFKRVYVLYDNDYNKTKNYGRLYGNILANKFGLTQIEIPEKYQSKDPSDLFNNHGPKAQINIIKNLL